MYLTCILTAAVLCAVAESLMPPGPVKRVGGLVCGLVLMWVLVEPLAGLNPEWGRRWLEENLTGREQEARLEEQVEKEMKVIIEGEYAAYIVDKAAQLGTECTVQVTCSGEEGGVLMPYEVRVTGVMDEKAARQLSQVIREDLGVPRERQRFEEGGVP